MDSRIKIRIGDRVYYKGKQYTVVGTSFDGESEAVSIQGNSTKWTVLGTGMAYHSCTMITLKTSELDDLANGFRE